MMYKLMAWITQAVFVLGIAISLSVAFVPEAFSQERVSKPKTVKMKPIKANVVKTEVSLFCKGLKVETSTSRGTTTYTCGGSGAAAGTTIQANPGVAKSKINCDYSQDGDGNVTWHGCTCTADGDSNCTSFITHCAQEGDEVGGNSGAATCSP